MSSSKSSTDAGSGSGAGGGGFCIVVVDTREDALALLGSAVAAPEFGSMGVDAKSSKREVAASRLQLQCRISKEQNSRKWNC